MNFGLGDTKNQIIMAGQVTETPTVDGYGTLGTSPVKAVIASGSVVRVKISNLSSSNRVAWTVVDAGAAAPTVSAAIDNAAVGAILAPGQVEYIVLSGKDLYVVGSAASSEICIVSFAV
jgi:hypothetical protein